MRTRAIRAGAGLGLALLLAGAGCGAPACTHNEKVEGTIRLDNVPLANVVVQFVPDVDATRQAPGSSAYTDARGHYQLTCDNQRPGAVVGKHRVVVLPGRAGAGDDVDAEAEAARKGRRGGPQVPAAYTRLQKTPLRVEVTPDLHSYDLSLTGKAAKR